MNLDSPPPPSPPQQPEPPEAKTRFGKMRRRRRRRQKRRLSQKALARRRGFLALLPSLFTTGNLAAGFFSITLTISERYELAAYAILAAVLFDVADGRIARLARATSRFGAEYDSIADTVSFGVAPALLAYGAGGLNALGWMGWVLAFIYTAGAALRLARFNVVPGRWRGRFDGLASPAAAGMVFSSVLFADFLQGFLQQRGYAVALPALLPGLGVAALGALMVSPIPYTSFKEVRLRGNYRNIVLMVFTLALLLLKPKISFFAFSIMYIASGPLGIYWRRRGRGAPLQAAQTRAEDESGGGNAP